MAIKQANDQDLRQGLYSNELVIVKYITPDCTMCAELESAYADLSEDEKYKTITFLRIDANQNPVAHREVGQKKMPFISIYRNALLLECATVNDEQGIKDLLNKLLASNTKQIID